MRTRRSVLSVAALFLAVAISACATSAGSGTLSQGMTPDEAVQAMGTPDLKDTIPDPNHSGASVLRYVWLDPGKVAVFGANNRVASISQIEPTQKAADVQEAAAEERAGPTATHFDPIETPLNYLFFPIKAAFIYSGAGLNCAAGGLCQKPKLPDPSHG